jgi:hypothetical protein
MLGLVLETGNKQRNSPWSSVCEYYGTAIYDGHMPVNIMALRYVMGTCL